MTRKPLLVGATYAALAALAIVYLFPFLWMVVQSLKTMADYYSRPPSLPVNPQWQNYGVLLGDPTFIRAALNSLIVAILIATLQVAVSSLAGFAFAMLNFRGKGLIFSAVLATMMVPATATIIPLFVIVKWMGMVNTYAGLVLPFVFTGFGIFLMRQFYLVLPRDLMSAARIDGASTFQIYALVFFPLAIPGSITLWVLAFVAYWNSLLWPLIATSSTELATLPQRVALLIGNNHGEPHILMAAAVLSILPVLILFAALQRFYVRGYATSGIK